MIPCDVSVIKIQNPLRRTLPNESACQSEHQHIVDRKMLPAINGLSSFNVRRELHRNLVQDMCESLTPALQPRRSTIALERRRLQALLDSLSRVVVIPSHRAPRRDDRYRATRTPCIPRLIEQVSLEALSEPRASCHASFSALETKTANQQLRDLASAESTRPEFHGRSAVTAPSSQEVRIRPTARPCPGGNQ